MGHAILVLFSRLRVLNYICITIKDISLQVTMLNGRDVDPALVFGLMVRSRFSPCG